MLKSKSRNAAPIVFRFGRFPCLPVWEIALLICGFRKVPAGLPIKEITPRRPACLWKSKKFLCACRSFLMLSSCEDLPPPPTKNIYNFQRGKQRGAFGLLSRCTKQGTGGHNTSYCLFFSDKGKAACWFLFILSRSPPDYVAGVASISSISTNSNSSKTPVIKALFMRVSKSFCGVKEG